MTTRRFELREGSSSKFWEVEPKGDALAIRWGKLGTADQSQEKAFADEAAAKKALDKLVLEKTKKGYAEIVEAAALTARSAASASEKPALKTSKTSTSKASVAARAEPSSDVVLKLRASFKTFQTDTRHFRRSVSVS